MPARYIQEQREEQELLERIKKMQPKFNTATSLEKYFHRAIKLIFSGEMDNATLNGSGIHPNIRKIYDFYNSIKAPEEKDQCRDAFLHLYNEKAFKLLENQEIMNGLINLMGMSLFWIREFNTWERKSHNIHKQFSDLARHLFAKYPVPLFLDAAWIGSDNIIRNGRAIDWFLHIGGGASARELNLPVAMTKRLAHEFVNTPDGYPINDAIRRAQILSMGGSESLAWNIFGSRIGHGRFENESFWATVILFFCKVPMMDYSHISSIIDYIHAQKFESIYVNEENGVIRRRVTYANANFSMKGRTIEALMRETEAWHNRLNRDRKHASVATSWLSTGITGLEMKSGSESNGTKREYNIVELVTSAELAKEGKMMHNCVSSYAGSCKSGRCSIWSLRSKYMHSFEEHLATIELSNRDKTIVQVRAKSNRKSDASEKAIVEKWARKVGLKISGSAFGGW